MNSLPFICHSIEITSYSKVRLRHIKYINQFSMFKSLSFSNEIKHSTYKKLKQFKKLTQIDLGDNYFIFLPGKYQKSFLRSIFQSIRVIKGGLISTDRIFQQLKNLRILRAVFIDNNDSARSLLYLPKLEEVGFISEKIKESIFTALFTLFTKIFIRLPVLKKVKYEGSEHQLVQAIISVMESRKIPLKDFLLYLRRSDQDEELSLGPLLNMTSVFSTNISSMKTFTQQFESINLMKNLSSLSLSFYGLDWSKFKFDLLEGLHDLENLKNLHLYIIAPLLDYFNNLRFPKSLTMLILELGESYEKGKSQINLANIQNAFCTLNSQITALHNLKTLRIIARPLTEDCQLALQGTLQSLLEKMPALIENFEARMVEKYEVGTNLLSYGEVLSHLNQAKHLKQLQLYLPLSTSNIDQKLFLSNLVSLTLTTYVEEYSINNVLCPLNPEKIENITIINQGNEAIHIKKAESSKFFHNLARFHLLNKLELSRFCFEDPSDAVIAQMRSTLIALEELKSAQINFEMETILDQDEINELKAVLLAKRKLQKFSMRITMSVTENGITNRKFMILLHERMDGEIKTQVF